MTKSTSLAAIAVSFPRKQMESTLYMPSMYDSDEEAAESRDEDIKTARGGDERLGSRYPLQRCLAWSQDEQEVEDRMDTEVATKDCLLSSLSSFNSVLVDLQASKNHKDGGGLPRQVWKEVSSDRDAGAILRKGNTF
jgi:hypothetical protein